MTGSPERLEELPNQSVGSNRTEPPPIRESRKIDEEDWPSELDEERNEEPMPAGEPAVQDEIEETEAEDVTDEPGRGHEEAWGDSL